MQHISVYKEFQKLNMFDQAIPAWQIAYNSCSGFKKIIYQDGIKFIRIALENEQNEEKHNSLIDSMIQVYQERIRYFSEEGLVSGILGIDLLRYGKSKHIQTAHSFLQKSMELRKTESDPAVLVALMNASEILFEQGKCSKEKIVETYLEITNILENQSINEVQNGGNKNTAQAIKAVELIFEKSKAADCESLENVFKEKFHAYKSDLEQLKNIQRIFVESACFESDLLYQVSVQIYQNNASPDNAYLIAGLLIKKAEYQEAIKFLNQAISMETTDSLKAIYKYELANIYCYKLSQWQQARNFANEAIQLNQTWGKPYLLIGDCYALWANSNNSKHFENQAIYWAAIDKYLTAKSIDASVNQTANQNINYYSQQMPTKEAIFLQGLKEGEKYLLGGWINEHTLVRARSGI
jgi:hypothetical protein